MVLCLGQIAGACAGICAEPRLEARAAESLWVGRYIEQQIGVYAVEAHRLLYMNCKDSYIYIRKSARWRRTHAQHERRAELCRTAARAITREPSPKRLVMHICSCVRNSERASKGRCADRCRSGRYAGGEAHAHFSCPFFSCWSKLKTTT